MKPPGSAKALMVFSRTAKNWKGRPPSGVCADRRWPMRLQVLVDLRIVDDRSLVAQLADDHRADPVLVATR